LLGQGFGVGFGRLHALAELSDLGVAGGLILALLVDALAQVEQEVKRARNIHDGKQRHYPLHCVSPASGHFDQMFAFVSHKFSPLVVIGCCPYCCAGKLWCQLLR
jgi:hypothetical protein